MKRIVYYLIIGFDIIFNLSLELLVFQEGKDVEDSNITFGT